ncbi:MAG TPA: hypothetical protein VFP61_12495 [Acidimicrobiales bacterium]|nr:hypothetical protein [Acidimicrobiales bacterium]
MDTYLLPGVYRYLATHSEVSISATAGVAVALGVVLGLATRETMRTFSRSEARIRVMVRRFNVVLLPLLLVALATVVERFRLLS